MATKGTKSKIVAHLPSSVELSKLSGGNSLWIDVKLWGSKEGRLHIAKGSVEWWPNYSKVNAHRSGWVNFVKLLEQMPTQRRA